MTKTIRRTLPYLTKMIGSHQFKVKTKQGITYSNFRCTLSYMLVLQNSDGSVVKIPTGSELVVYRHPTETFDRSTVACFHHKGGGMQTVIYGGGRTVTQQLGRRSLIDGNRRLPRLSLASD